MDLQNLIYLLCELTEPALLAERMAERMEK